MFTSDHHRRRRPVTDVVYSDLYVIQHVINDVAISETRWYSEQMYCSFLGSVSYLDAREKVDGVVRMVR